MRVAVQAASCRHRDGLRKPSAPAIGFPSPSCAWMTVASPAHAQGPPAGHTSDSQGSRKWAPPLERTDVHRLPEPKALTRLQQILWPLVSTCPSCPRCSRAHDSCGVCVLHVSEHLWSREGEEHTCMLGRERHGFGVNDPTRGLKSNGQRHPFYCILH